ncbi:MAG: 30S ribosome-binding factor RbfA [Candidatus Promineifilaceae bacterium]
MNTIRQQRTADQIRLILSQLLLRELRDPRLSELTVTDVTVDRELQVADIYVQALGDDSRQADVTAALQGASGYLRRELAGRLRLRTVPQLRFHWDPSLAQAERISRLLDSLDIPADSAATEEE